MTIADMIPGMTDDSLSALRANATRLSADKGPKQVQASELLPLIEAEQAARLAAKPKPVRAVRKKAAPKVKAKVVEDADAETAEAELAAS